MDQLHMWLGLEAGENGMRNFGMPMKASPLYRGDMIWGVNVHIYKEGVKQTTIGVGFDEGMAFKSEYIGQGADGFPTKEGKQEEVEGEYFEIW